MNRKKWEIMASSPRPGAPQTAEHPEIAKLGRFRAFPALPSTRAKNCLKMRGPNFRHIGVGCAGTEADLHDVRRMLQRAVGIGHLPTARWICTHRAGSRERPAKSRRTSTGVQRDGFGSASTQPVARCARSRPRVADRSTRRRATPSVGTDNILTLAMGDARVKPFVQRSIDRRPMTAADTSKRPG